MAAKWAVSKLGIRRDTSETAIGAFAMSNQARGGRFRVRVHHPNWDPTPSCGITATITPSTPCACDDEGRKKQLWHL